MSVKTATRALRRRPAPELKYYLTTVTRTQRLTPHMTRISFAGADLTEFRWDGPDQRVKLFLPLPGQRIPDVPTGADWYPCYLKMSDETRPIMRTYTLRGHHPERNEVEIDFVLHTDHSGPASTWAASARVGDYAGIYGPYADYDPVPDTDWQLICGDETALPAIGGIIEGLPTGTLARAFIEVVGPDDERGFETKGDVEVTWVHRGAEANGDNSSLARVIADAELPPGRPYAWLAAEAGVVKRMRRHLAGERGYNRADIYFAGYWRVGRSEDQRATADDE